MVVLVWRNVIKHAAVTTRFQIYSIMSVMIIFRVKFIRMIAKTQPGKRRTQTNIDAERIAHR